MIDPFLTALPVPNRMAGDDAFRLIRGRQRWAWAHPNDRAAYAEWIRGHTVLCVCDQPITRTTWLGSRYRLDPLEEPEGTWTHDTGDGATWDTAGHRTRPLLLVDLFPEMSPPCATHSHPQPRYHGDPYQPPAGQRAAFGPALTGPFDTRAPLFDRIFDRLWALLD